MHKKYSKSHIKGAKTCKNGKKCMSFLVWVYTSQYFAQTQQNFAQSHDRVTVTFRNSAVLVYKPCRTGTGCHPTELLYNAPSFTWIRIWTALLYTPFCTIPGPSVLLEICLTLSWTSGHWTDCTNSTQEPMHAKLQKLLDSEEGRESLLYVKGRQKN